MKQKNELVTDFLIQKRNDRGALYHKRPGIWFSEEIKRWVVTAPDLIKTIMLSEAFAVPSYDVSPVTDKLGIDLSYLDELRRWFPLAEEGERHSQLREMFARHIARNTPAALSSLCKELALRKSLLAEMEVGKEFCMYAIVIYPAIKKAVHALAQAELPDDLDTIGIPQLFDDAISPSKRRAINETIGKILFHLPQDWSNEEKYLSTAVIALSANTLLASVAQTFVHIMRSSPTKSMCSIDWGVDLKRTGLPLIEKKVVRDTVLAAYTLKRGDRVRLFIESDGVLPDGHYRYSDIFFAVGPHKCVGMNFSRQAWFQFSRELGQINRSMIILDNSERPGDYVFNLPNKIMVKFYD